MKVLQGQLALELFEEEERNEQCIWVSMWYGYPFCYLRQTFRIDDGCFVGDCPELRSKNESR